jgi:hypothetical protein
MYVPGPAPTGGQANCRLYTNGNFSTTSLEGLHYAYVTDPPTTEAQLSDAKRCSTECPYADGQLYVSPTGEVSHECTQSYLLKSDADTSE